MIIRNDDVNPNTDFNTLNNIYDVIKEFTDAEILSCVNVLGRANKDGTVYPGVPFKNNPLQWFYNVNKIERFNAWRLYKVASHGLFHCDHTKLSKGAQELSILSSCHMLNTNCFVAPFNRFNEDTVKACEENNITLIGKNENWKCLDFEDFDSRHEFWYFHSWRFTPQLLKEKLSADIKARNSVELG